MAGLAPPVNTVTVKAPRFNTEGGMKSHRAGSSAQLIRTPALPALGGHGGVHGDIIGGAHDEHESLSASREVLEAQIT